MRKLTKSLLTMAGWLLLITVPGRADTFIVNDLTSTLSITQVGGSDTWTGGCTLEGCLITVTSKNPTQENLGFFGGIGVAIADPGGLIISDLINTDATSFNSFYRLIFTSDPSIGGNCRDLIFPVGCKITEDGTIQTAGTVSWFGRTGTLIRSDTIQFASDAELPDTTAPEPSPMLLLGTGLLALVTFAQVRQGRRASLLSRPS